VFFSAKQFSTLLEAGTESSTNGHGHAQDRTTNEEVNDLTVHTMGRVGNRNGSPKLARGLQGGGYWSMLSGRSRPMFMTSPSTSTEANREMEICLS
jgi:hypothetical protein